MFYAGGTAPFGLAAASNLSARLREAGAIPKPYRRLPRAKSCDFRPGMTHRMINSTTNGISKKNQIASL